MIGSMCAAIVLTNGRSVASERAVLATIDNAGTRSITITARSGETFDSGLVERVLSLTEIEWVGASQFISDASNSQILDGHTVGVRRLWASSWKRIGLPSPQNGSASVYATDATLASLGLADGVGTIRARDGIEWFVAGTAQLPSFLAALGSSVLILEKERTTTERFDQITVLTRSTSHIEAIANVLGTLVNLDDPSKFTISASQQLAEVRSAVRGQLSEFGRNLALGITSITSVLTCSVMILSVMQRRRDFGRRRALGATRSLIAALIVAQTGGLSAIGAIAGIGVASTVLMTTDAPTPPLDYLAAVAVLAIQVSLVAAIVPAILASRRDPIRELRVP
ncbi:FtsX-like permease family protein [uncultured Leifsonia sp.]|jgi:putative ABC transport system permease protein|uniref:FtsX-like permease family protein n=1 Tax=uncultured Leifsonia sp. TaxID=340359 RepID=UPI0025D6A9F4|nr:FtsX-like permease family protein [uncultured Leifsonia sp.]